MNAETQDRYDAETQRIAHTLFLLVQRKGVSIRSLEHKMKVGDSVFNKVLKGRVTLQVRHVLMIADALGITWKQFFALAYGLPVPEAKEEPPAPNPEDVIAEKVVQALIRRLLGTPPEPPKPAGPPPSSAMR